MKTEMGTLIEMMKGKAVCFTSDFSKAELKVIKLMIEDGMVKTFCKGKGHPKQYFLTEKGKHVAKLSGF
jgi:hypothetical protein